MHNFFGVEKIKLFEFNSPRRSIIMIPEQYLASPYRATWDKIRDEMIVFERINITRIYPVMEYLRRADPEEHDKFSNKVQADTITFLRQMLNCIGMITRDVDDFSHKIAILLLYGTVDDVFCRLYLPHRFYTYIVLSYARCISDHDGDDIMRALPPTWREKINNWLALAECIASGQQPASLRM